MLLCDLLLAFLHTGIAILMEGQVAVAPGIQVGHKGLQHGAALDFIPDLRVYGLSVCRRLPFWRGTVPIVCKGDNLKHAAGDVGLPVKGDVRMVEVGDTEDADAPGAAGQGQLFRPFFLPFPCDARICRAEVSGDSVVYMAQEQALCGYAVRFLHPG